MTLKRVVARLSEVAISLQLYNKWNAERERFVSILKKLGVKIGKSYTSHDGYAVIVAPSQLLECRITFEGTKKLKAEGSKFRIVSIDAKHLRSPELIYLGSDLKSLSKKIATYLTRPRLKEPRDTSEKPRLTELKDGVYWANPGTVILVPWDEGLDTNLGYPSSSWKKVQAFLNGAKGYHLTLGDGGSAYVFSEAPKKISKMTDIHHPTDKAELVQCPGPGILIIGLPYE